MPERSAEANHAPKDGQLLLLLSYGRTRKLNHRSSPGASKLLQGLRRVVDSYLKRTSRLTDAGPMVFDCQPRPDPGVRCSRLVRCWFAPIHDGRQLLARSCAKEVCGCRRSALSRLNRDDPSATDADLPRPSPPPLQSGKCSQGHPL